MRLLPISLLSTLFASVVLAQSGDGSDEASDVPKPTIFNGVEVPPLPEIDGESFNKTVADGYWFVKHHSPYCPHCIHIAPTWQTLYEFYYTSKPVKASTDDKSTSLNTFTAYYNYHFGSLDCIAFGTACTDHGVTSFPTFILYKDGTEFKRFVGPKDMQKLGAFIEENLESIRPGSRPVGGPAYPEERATQSPDYKPAAKESEKSTEKSTEKPAEKPAEKTAEKSEKSSDKSTEKPSEKAPEKPSEKAPEKASEKSTEKAPEGSAQKPETAANIVVPAKDANKDASKGAGKDAKEAGKETKPDAAKITTKPTLKATPIEKKPSKPTQTANPLGTSVSLTAESFQNLVTMSQDPWFIKFYAPWCHHCQAMAPNWAQLAKEMKGKLNVGEVNCEAEARLCKDVHVRGYPTIHFFRGGERVEYEGLRGLGDFVTFANKAVDIGDGVKDIDAAGFKELEEKEDVIFVYFYDHATTSEDFAALERLTLSLIGHAKLVKTNSAALADRFKITTWPRLLVSRDGRPTYYTALAPQDMRDFRQVLHWMQSVWLPVVPELTASNSREIMDGKIVVLAILSRDRAADFVMAKKELKQAALEWMDKQIINFQRERQELRDAKQLRLEEAEDRNDQRALRAAKSIRINMDKSDQKEVGFAWVDGVFWERWIRSTYGIEVKTDGEKVIINDEDNRRYWDTTITGNYIIPSRTSILETIPKVVSNPPVIKPKSTVGSLEKMFFNIRGAISGHPFLSFGLALGIVLGITMYGRGKVGSRRGGFFRVDDGKDGLLGGVNAGGKVD
ncbi:hypothetical protein MFRU_053g00450 [Monilinia fructicola]|uniref:Thioredoxin domain-containing protein n=1 Tax=Monilinia fructicola TaxID=38448 RepID=A0A5M9K326_MONFR|nr:hypothetical protein EYC84_003793 [Monilinia fructicola]KAG4025676.1 hypothetical protein MFRU_053g00450 [Monilinia fructicola]